MARVPVCDGAAQGTDTSVTCHVRTHGPKHHDTDELCTLLVEPMFLGHVSEHTFTSANTEMPQFVRHARG